MKPCAPEIWQAVTILWSSASGLTMRSPSTMGPLNQYTCWARQPIQRPSSARGNWAMSYSSMKMRPCVGW